jgi:hypothetical protein
MSDLFAGPTASGESTVDESQEPEWMRSCLQVEYRGAVDEYCRFQRAHDVNARKLACAADDAPGVEALVRRFHETEDELHRLEVELEELERALANW